MDQHFKSVVLQPSSKYELRVKFPFSTSTPGLFLTIHQSVEAVYSEMDKLEGSGLGIGLDCLPNEIPLAELKDIELFSGTIFLVWGLLKSGCREMLWIEYRASVKVEISSIKDVLETLAQIITPYPVCAYDKGEHGLGLVVHDGVYDDDDDNGDGDFSQSSTALRDTTPMDGIELSSEFTSFHNTAVGDTAVTSSSMQRTYDAVGTPRSDANDGVDQADGVDGGNNNVNGDGNDSREDQNQNGDNDNHGDAGDSSHSATSTARCASRAAT